MATSPTSRFLLKTLAVFQTDDFRFFGLLSITLSERLCFPDAHPLSEQFCAVGFTPQFSPFKEINDGNVPSVKVNIDFFAAKSIQQPRTDIAISQERQPTVRGNRVPPGDRVLAIDGFHEEQLQIIW